METKFIEVELNFHEVNDLYEMHILLKKTFGFPEFYGKNVNALIDCLSSIRNPEDGMTTLVLGVNENLLIKARGLSSKSELIINNFLVSIESVNERFLMLAKEIPIYLILI